MVDNTLKILIIGWCKGLLSKLLHLSRVFKACILASQSEIKGKIVERFNHSFLS